MTTSRGQDREVADVQRQGFRAAHRAGVNMVFGTDAGVMPHATAAGQFATMVRYGMTPMQAIQAATRSPSCVPRSMDVRKCMPPWTRASPISRTSASTSA